MKALVESFTEQLKAAKNIASKAVISKSGSIQNIIVTGLGGSGIGGTILNELVSDSCSVPIMINKDYFLPAFANANTLLIVSSYSGNTEETLEVLRKAKDKAGKIICITSGGAILDFAKENNYDYIVIDGGKATSYGAEASINVAVVKQLELFGNYAWLHTAFDSTNTNGLKQEYAGNQFSLAPEHSFTAGFNAQFNITETIQLFVSPSYSFKTHIWFTDATTWGLDQNAYGLLHVNGGLKLTEPKLMLSVYAINLLNEKYVTSGGNTSHLFG